MIKYTIMKIQRSIAGWTTPLLHLLFPEICPVCGKSLFGFEKVICTPCTVHLPLTRYSGRSDNKVAAIFWGRIGLIHCSAFLHYKKGNSVQKMIHQLKYRGRQDIGYHLGTLCGREIAGIPSLGDLSGIIPVPLHPKKERIRGYNQCFSIARGIASVLNIPVLDRVAVRNTFNTSQTKKDRYSRWENTREKFTLRDPEAIADRHFLLVDDVVTTGSTLEALATTLSGAPGVRLSIVTIGSTC
jgi:ComF family protein